MIHYILQIIAFQLLFLLVYDLFLKKETFFNWNRAYLIITPLLSFILPMIEIDLIRKQVPSAYIIELPTVLIDTSTTYISLPEVFLTAVNTDAPYIPIGNILLFLWIFGMITGLLLFLHKIRTILRLKRIGIKTQIDNLNLVSLPKTNTAFSFFNTIFLGESLSENKKAHILLHEKVHATEYHSFDLLFFEVLRVILWFNPLVYVYQKRISLLQEYIADAKAIKETDKKTYYQGLLAQVFQTDKISFINTFFNHSLIKNRIVMLQKSKSKKIVQLRYLLLLPVVCSMLIYTSCSQESNAQEAEDLAKTALMKKIDAVEEQIQIQGNVSPDEEKALKRLALLVSNDVSNPLFKDARDIAGIPFGVIEKVPVYPGCENLSQEESKKCFAEKVSSFIAKEFDTDIAKENGITGVQRIHTQFSIGTDGIVKDIKIKNDIKEVSMEAFRVIRNLPKMKPGIQDGVPVSVMYSLPIVFEIK